MASHPDIEEEQAHLDQCYERLGAMRVAARALIEPVLDQGRGGTHQAREERDVMVRTGLARLEQLDIGDRPLCFGRIDHAPASGPDGGPGHAGASYHIGRLAVSGDDLEPLVVDWRAPVAEPFYRATGRQPMGLARRRHFATEGRRLVSIEDELFGPPQDAGRAVPASEEPASEDLPSGALLAAMGRSRSGHLRDIVATVQREQDEIIRAGLPGLLVVQGGPGTGKTVVALHRAAYLLYTHRFPLERQGVLVVGPNQVYLRYIEQVLPSLGENGVVSSTVAGLFGGVRAQAREPEAVARLKGQARMAGVVAAAVRGRQRPPRGDLVVASGSVLARVSQDELAALVANVARRAGTHNRRRRLVEILLVRRLVERYRQARERALAARPRPEGAGAEIEALLAGGDGAGGDGAGGDGAGGDGASGDGASGNGAAGHGSSIDDADDDEQVAGQLRRMPVVVEALDRMWPRLRPEELLHDLYGAPPLIALAGRGVLSPAEQASLYRPRSHSLETIPWSRDDAALLDEARALLGPVRAGQDEPRTYGHILVDEAQDLSPMQLRMLGRRSLSGSMTLVGDIAQATGPHAGASWDDITAHLAKGSAARLVELSVNYRTPAEIMELAGRVLAQAAPQLSPPRSVRSTGEAPVVRRAPPESLVGTAVDTLRGELGAVGRAGDRAGGTVAAIVPRALASALAQALVAAGLPAGLAGGDGRGRPGGLESRITVLSVELAKGLEFDSVVVLEPGRLVAEHGLRALYVAMTRPTRRLSVLHSGDLPATLAGP